MRLPTKRFALSTGLLISAGLLPALKADADGVVAASAEASAQTGEYTVTPKALTVSGSTVANRNYDGTTTGVVTVGTVSDALSGEMLDTTTANITKANAVTIGAAANAMLMSTKPVVAQKQLAKR